MKPPKDPILRAIWRVSIAGKGKDDALSATEKLVLLTLWRYLRDGRKSVGPSLIAALIGSTSQTVRTALVRLRSKGYIGSTGRRSKGNRCAERWLTKKVKWPRSRDNGTRVKDVNARQESAQSVTGIRADLGGLTCGRSDRLSAEAPAGKEARCAAADLKPIKLVQNKLDAERRAGA